MVIIDTIKPEVAEVKEKKLFGRLADAFASKKKKVDTGTTLVKKQITLDTSFSSRAYNKRQLKNISTYFKNMYATNKFLNQNQIEILRINSKIINQIVELIQHYKKLDEDFLHQSKSNIKDDLDRTFESLGKIYNLIFVLLFVLLIVILFNLWKIYKKEAELIDYGTKASMYAESKSRFLANMSHEIRTPLNSVIGFSEQLSKDNLSPQQLEQVQSIKTSSELLLDLINDILDFSKYEIDKIKFDEYSFSIIDSINEVINSIGVQAQRKNIELNRNFSISKDFYVKGDALRLKQVVMNLLSNAIKFTDKGSVTINVDAVVTAKQKALLKVSVVDTGIGIDEKDIALLFEEFSQVNYAATRNTQKGTGLGLAICKRIVELQNGSVGLESKLGKGSIFSFEIPYLMSDEMDKKKGATPVNKASLVGKKVLLVDDNKLNILLAQTVVKKYEMVTEIANNGKEAYELFEKSNYDLILTDIQMPVMGGVELTKLIREFPDPEKSNIPVLGVTANIMPEDRERYLATGINDLVLKPYSEVELMQKIVDYI